MDASEDLIAYCGLEAPCLARAGEFLSDGARRADAETFRARYLGPNAPGGTPAAPAPDALEASGLLQLAAVLRALPDARLAYRALGWPEAALRETLSDVGIWARHHFRNYGCWGLAWIGTTWIARQLRAEVVRLGRLQCELEREHAGRPVIGLHIPEDGPLDPAACRRSFGRMVEFFARHRPGYAYVGATCESWFLDPQLESVMGPDSNMVRFRQWGEPYACGEPSDAVFRVFGVKAVAEGVDAVPHATRLQRALAEFLRRGGVPRTGGIFIPRPAFERLALP